MLQLNAMALNRLRGLAFIVFFGIHAMSIQPAHAMNAGDALRLTQAWAHSSRAATELAGMTVQPSGDFEVDVRGAHLAYSSASRQLVVSGLVGTGVVQFIVAPEPWQELQAAAAREANTLGEGRFELVDRKVFHSDPPVLLLSKAFSDGKMTETQFLIEVRWLLEWATHWRKTRVPELFSARTPQEIERLGQGYVDWARKRRPRPW